MRAIAPTFLPTLAKTMAEQGVELRGDDVTQTYIAVAPTTEEDWKTEYSDLVLAIKVVRLC